MGRKSAAGTRPLNVEIEESLRERLDARVAVEDRTLRSVVERALRAYLTTPSEDEPIVERKPAAKKAK
jgi:metal-responsive CopG/Arc/MetJ family transcriptional regulator